MKLTVSEAERAAMIQDLAYKIIGQTHADWTELTQARRNYLEDRDACYSYLKQQVLTNWVNAGGKKAVLMDAMVQYARNDWVSAGGRVEEFERQLRAARRNSK